jgi:hypothetical protein
MQEKNDAPLQRIGHGVAANKATCAVVSTFGALAALAGIEHGVGEILQGASAPGSMFFASWPGSSFFHVVAGEPAMSLVPSFLASGVLSILLSIGFFVWTVFFHRVRLASLVTILLSVVLLLIGGGFGPPLLGILVGLAGTSTNSKLAGWRKRIPVVVRSVLGMLWPWILALSIANWLLVLPGLMLIDLGVGIRNPESVVPGVTLCAFAGLLLSILTGLAKDSSAAPFGEKPSP